MKQDLVAVFIGLAFLICLTSVINTITSDQHLNKIVETCKESK